jgi:hypothetical protein
LTLQPLETVMQRYPDDLSESERRIARRWTLGSVGLYGSLLAALALYAVFSPSHFDPSHFDPSHPGNVASNDAEARFSVANATRVPGAPRPARATAPRTCAQGSC